MAEIVNPIVEGGVFVGMDPATGIVAGIAGDGTVKVLEAWDPVQGDVHHTAPAGSVGGGGTRRHLFDREVYVDTGGAVYVNVRAWASITGKPTTIAGYGITDAITTAGGQTIAGQLTVSSIRTGAATWASLGQVRLPNNNVIAWRNAADSADFTLRLGTGNRFALDAGLDINGATSPVADNSSDLGDASHRWRAAFFSGTVSGTLITLNTATSAYVAYQNAGVDKWYAGRGVSGNTNEFQIYSATFGGIAFKINDATLLANFGGAVAVAGTVTMGSGSQVAGGGVLKLGTATANAGAAAQFLGWSGGNSNWQIETAYIGTGLNFTPSTGAGGAVFTTPAMTLTTAGLIVSTATGFAVGAIASTPRIAYGTVGTKFNFLTAGNGNAVLETGEIHAETDAAFDIGTASLRFRDANLSRHVKLGGDLTLTAGAVIMGAGQERQITVTGSSTTETMNFNRWNGTTYVTDFAFIGTGPSFLAQTTATGATSLVTLNGASGFAGGGGIFTALQNGGSQLWRYGYDFTQNAFTWRNAADVVVATIANGGTLGLGGGVVCIGVTTETANACALIATNTNAALTAVMQAWNKATTTDCIFLDMYTEGGSGARRGLIDYNRGGGVVRYNTTSDGNLKTLVDDGRAPRAKSTALLAAITLREWYWNGDETQKRQISPIAQELVKVFPGAVSVGGMAEREVDGETVEVYEPWAVDKTAAVWHLVAGWQDHDARIAQLERENEELRARLAPAA